MRLIFLALFALASASMPDAHAAFREALMRPEIRSQIEFAQKIWQKSQQLRPTLGLGDISVECGLCGIAINEVEGFMAENITETEIQKIIAQDLCSNLSGYLATVCMGFVGLIPTIISGYENRWDVSVICVDTGFCQQPFNEPTDPQPIPVYNISLDLPPNQRWIEICSNPSFQQNAQFLYNTVTSLLLNNGEAIEDIGEMLNTKYFPTEQAQEIQGCSSVLGVPFGWLSLFNLGYEVSDACTSIVAQDPAGNILHARNLDFWAGMGFTNTLKLLAIEAHWQRGGVTQFKTTTFAGYSGALSGIKLGAFSVTINTRFYPQGISELFYEVIAAIEEKNASLVSFLARHALQNLNSFDAALENLSNDPLIADVYYTMAGISAGQGVVISRNRMNATNVWQLDAPSRWYEVQTNYDHWEPPPWFDNRLDPANDAMDEMGEQNASLEGMWTVISTKPVFNLQTTYSILSCPATGQYQSFARYCPYPCVQ
jgi:hypothetical protein